MSSERRDTHVVEYLHSSHATAVSILRDVDPNSAMAALRAYDMLRVGGLPSVSDLVPRDPDLAHAVRLLASRHHAVLLANHGPVVADTSLNNAQYTVEELEEAPKIF